MTYRSYPYAWIYYCTHQYLSINFETKNQDFLLNLILDLTLVILTRMFMLWVQNIEFYLWCSLNIFILLIHWSHFLRVLKNSFFWFKTSCFELEKWVFEMKHICALWIIEYWQRRVLKIYTAQIFQN
jgi:hypothetical protein